MKMLTTNKNEESLNDKILTLKNNLLSVIASQKEKLILFDKSSEPDEQMSFDKLLKE